MPCKHKLVNRKYDTMTIRELSPSSLRRGLRPVCGNSPSQIDLPIRSAGQITLVNGCVKINNRTFTCTRGLTCRKTICLFTTTSHCFVNCNKSMPLTPKGLRKKGYETHLCQKLGYFLLTVILTGFLINPINVSNFYSTNNGSCLIPLKYIRTLNRVFCMHLPVLLNHNTLVHSPWFGNQCFVQLSDLI